MTTALVQSITDEQIAEIERGCFDATPYAVEKLITRLREAEKDAARYRWIRESTASIAIDGDVLELKLDEAVDTAMQEHKQ